MLLVGGDFGPAPRPSGYFHKLYEAVRQHLADAMGVSYYNGGSFEQLEELLDKVEEFSVSVLQAFSTEAGYKAYMAKARPFILAGLRGYLMKASIDHKDTLTQGIKVTVQVNTLGLLWGELVRMANGNILMMPEVSEEEALARTEKRGSFKDTTLGIRRLEQQLCPTGGWFDWCTNRGYNVTEVGCNDIKRRPFESL